MAELAASIIFGVSEECISVLALAFTDEESQKSGRKGWMGIGRMSLKYIAVVEKAFQKENIDIIRGRSFSTGYYQW